MSEWPLPRAGTSSAAVLILALALSSCRLPEIETPRYALVYGISIYDDTKKEYQGINLRFADDDARAVSQMLRDQGWTIFAEVARGTPTQNTNAVVLMPDATKSRVAQDFIDLSSAIPNNALVLIYFSGHGLGTADGEYIALFGTTYNKIAEGDYSNCLSPVELQSYISGLPTKNVVVVIDTCNSGGFVTTNSEKDIAPQNYGEQDDGTIPDVLTTAISSFGELLTANTEKTRTSIPIIIAAAGSLESSYDDSQHSQGAFTYYFLQTPFSADSDGNGLVTATEVYSYCSTSIKKNWNVIYQNAFDGDTKMFMDFMPHISGGARDLVLFTTMK